MAELVIFILVVAGAFVVLVGLAAFEIGLSKWAVARKKRKLNKLLKGQSLVEILRKV